MSIKEIINPWIDTQGFNCIACCPTNKQGLHLEFFEEGDDIFTRWKPNDDFQGWMDTLHGGIQALLIDETAGWVVCRKLQTTGVTSKMEIQYLKPVSTKLDHLTVRARIARTMRNLAFIDAEVYDSDGTVCTKASLLFFCASKEKAAKELGFTACEVEE